MAPDGAKMVQDEAKMAQDGARMAQDVGQTSPEESRKQNNKTSLYALTPDHPALLAPYYIIYNI